MTMAVRLPCGRGKASPDFVILRIYGDMYIAARFDRKNNITYDELTLLWLDKFKQAEFRIVKTGPLTASPPPDLSVRVLQPEHNSDPKPYSGFELSDLKEAHR